MSKLTKKEKQMVCNKLKKEKGKDFVKIQKKLKCKHIGGKVF